MAFWYSIESILIHFKLLINLISACYGELIKLDVLKKLENAGANAYNEYNETCLTMGKAYK